MLHILGIARYMSIHNTRLYRIEAEERARHPSPVATKQLKHNDF